MKKNKKFLNLKNKKIIVIGYAGFIGRKIVENLIHQGYTVIGIDLKNINQLPQFTTFIKKKKLINFQADLNDTEQLTFVLNEAKKINASAIINTSGFVTYNIDEKTEKLLYEVNVNIIKNLYKVLKETKLKPQVLIHLGTLSSYGRPEAIINEDSPKIVTTPYVKTKIEGEKLIKKISKDYKIPYIIFHPSLVYGEMDNYSFIRMFINLAKKIKLIPVFGSGNIRCSPIIYVDDLAKIIIEAIKGKLPLNQEYIVFGESLLWNDIAAAINKVTKSITIHIPKIFAYPGMSILGFVMQLLKRPSFFNRKSLNKMLLDYRVERNKLDQYLPDYSFEKFEYRVKSLIF